MVVFDTPNKARIFQLSERLSGLSYGLQGERNLRISAVEQRLRDLEERINQYHDHEDSRFQILRDQISKVHDCLNQEKLARETVAEAKRKEELILSCKLQFGIENQKQTRRDSHNVLLEALESKIGDLKREIVSEAASLQDSQDRQLQIQKGRLPKLKQALEEEVESKEVMEARLRERIHSELGRVHAAILTEKKAREETEQVLLKMLEEVVGKLHQELQNERKERERTEQTLMNFLEQTCLKIGDAHNL